MKLIPDLREFIELLISKKVRFVIIGGWAFNYHATPRATGDIDFFVDGNLENQRLIREALEDFGFGKVLPEGKRVLFGSKKVIMLGEQPNRIDLIREIDGVGFEEVWRSKVNGNLDGLKVFFIDKKSLLKNKKAAGRPKDLADIDMLKQLGRKKKR